MAYQGGGRWHNNTTPRSIIPSPQLSRRENAALSKRGGGGTTVPDPVGPDPPLHRQNERVPQYQEGGRGTTVPDPVGLYPPLPRQNEKIQQRGHNSNMPRMTIPSTPPSSERIPPYQGGVMGHNSTRPRRIIPSPQLSKRENAAVSRGMEGAQQPQTP